MSWQYTYTLPQSSPYHQLYPQTQEPYAGQNYQQAWYGYYQQQAQAQRQAAPIAVGTLAMPPTATTPAVATAPSTTTTFSSYNPTFVREPSLAGPSSGAGATTRGPRRQSQLKGLFAKELPKLMYGFGDDKLVANDSVAVMEEILTEYIVDVCQTALSTTRKTRLQIEDLRRALSRPADAKKLARMEELLFMQEDIKRARKQFEENEMGGGDDF